MMYDRDYMRDDDRPRWRSPVNILLAVLVAFFLLECFLQVFANRSSLAPYFGLTYPAVAQHQYWRIFTYEFLHVAPWPFHLLFNGIGLWFFGRAILETLGAARFWQVYLGAGFAGALVELACQHWHRFYGVVPTVGASGCILGLAGAYCFLNPQQETCVLIYFFPVRMRAITMFRVLFGMSLFGVIFPYGGIAHGAHLGGLLAGVAYVKFVLDESVRAWWLRFLPRRPVRRHPVPVAVAKATAAGSERTAVPAAEAESPEDFMKREVDPILDKISAHGLQSLTERERRVLERARERMRGR